VTGYFRSAFMVDNTMEYMSPDFHNLGPQLFLGVVLLAMASLAVNHRRPSRVDLLSLLVWTGLGFYSARNIPLFVVICLPIVARLATEAWIRNVAAPFMGARDLGGEDDAAPPGPRRLKPAATAPVSPSIAGRIDGRNAVQESKRLGLSGRLIATERRLGRPLLPLLAVSVALWLTIQGPGELRPRASFDPAVFPTEALAKAEGVGVQGRMFNFFSWGGYVLYAGYPRYRVFIDGQTDFYGEALMRDYLRVARLEPGWEEVLDRYHVGWVLFPHQSPLSQLLARSSGWKPAYADSTADIFVRAAPEGR
jgi:hypothetical protein